MSARALAAAGATRVIIPNAVEPWDLTLNPDDSPEVRQQQLEGLIQRMRAVGVRKYDIPLFSAHQMGSCKMGASRESSACDPHGECWDVAGLFIGDGSAFPTPSGVNPMITIYGLAYLTALGIASRWRERCAA
jgi:long-chain-alcohol oxidase